MNITTPLTKDVAAMLKAGDKVYITGKIYTARDAAHKKMTEQLQNGEKLPIDVENQIIYYVGPCPAKPGHIIGSCGPTTSGRMDAYAPKLIELGLTGMIGKGERLPQVHEAMKNHTAVYFGAIGGAGALMAKCVRSVKEIAYPELLSESLKELYVENMPVIVIADCHGGNLYTSEKEKYRSI